MSMFWIRFWLIFSIHEITVAVININLTPTFPSTTYHRSSLDGKKMTIKAECEGCSLRFIIGLSCSLDDPKPRFEGVPFKFNDSVVVEESKTYTWTSSEAYGVSLIVADITPPITISELVQFTKLADKYLHYVYVLTVLSDAFFKVPPDLIAHVVLYHPPQSFTKIGAETIHTFVTPPRGNRVSFTEIRPLGGDTNEDDCVFYGYLGSIEDALDSKRFVDKFTCDGRTMIPELLWSYTIATLRFGKATFDITCTTKPFHFNYLLLRNSTNGIDTRYTDELSHGYPSTIGPAVGTFRYSYWFERDPLIHFFLTVENITQGILSYSMYYLNDDGEFDSLLLSFTESQTWPYCSSRLYRIETTWIPSVVSARLRTRLEWHRQADPMRRCTEIIPRPSTTGVIMSTTPGVVRSSGIGANFRLVGIIVSSVLGTICLLVGLILLIRWRRKRLIEFEQGIARQIARLLEKHDPRWYLGPHVGVNLLADAEWEIDQTALKFGEELKRNEMHLIRKTILHGALPCTMVYPSLKVVYPITATGHEVIAKTAVKEHARIEMLKEIVVLKAIPPHAHLLSLLGCTSDPSDPMIITEYCANGDLLSCVEKIRKREDRDEWSVTIADYPSISWQVADGMAFLANLRIVHRDLAAKNVLMTAEKMAKITGFALSRTEDDHDYMRNLRHNRARLRWSAPEAVSDGSFSEKSDVWSFGVLLWEMHTFGETPFEKIPPERFPDYLNSGQTLVPPESTPHWMVELMHSCWRLKPKLRPTFATLCDRLRNHVQLLKHNEYYLNLSHLPEIFSETPVQAAHPEDPETEGIVENGGFDDSTTATI